MTTQTPDIIGKRIRAARKQKGLTIKELSLLVNLAPSSIQNYESGIRQPALDTLKVLAKALDCSAVWLSTLSDINEGAESYSYSLINPVVPGRSSLEADSVMFSAKHIEAHGVSVALTKLIKITDDYLSPDIREGDEVLVNTGDKNISVKADFFCFADTSQQTIVRWARRDIGKGGFHLYANNNTHSPETFIPDDTNTVFIIGKVISLVRWI